MVASRLPATTISILLLLSLVATPAAAVTGGIEVQVADKGQPVPGATVSLFDDGEKIAEAESDASGAVRLPVEEGDYTLEVQKGGETVTSEIEVGGGALDTWTVNGAIEQQSEPLPTSQPLLEIDTKADFRASYRVENALVTVELGTPQGIIYLSAAELVELNTQVSWGITLWPTGDTPKKQQKNRETLADYGLNIGGVDVDLKSQQWVRVEASVRTRVVLSKGRNDVAMGYVPTRIGTQNGWEPASDIVRAGEGLSFHGHFDGDASNTRIQIGGKDVRVVAESTVSVAIYTDAGVIGLTSVTIFEGNLEQFTRFRNLGLETSIDQAHLRRGQRTTAHIKVTGLGGITEPAYLSVINFTPRIITLAPRNAQVITIDPSLVRADGTYQIDPGVTGVTPGGFIIFTKVLSR